MNYKSQKIINKLTFGLTEMCPGCTLSDIWYNFKNGISNLKTFFWTIWKWRSWDFQYNLEVLGKTIEVYLEKSQYSPAMEIDESRIPKETKMKRVLVIIKNIKEDDYLNAAETELGIKYPFKDIDFKEVEIHGQPMFEMIDNHTDEENEIIKKLITRSNEIQMDEWNELWDIIKSDAQGWWT